MAYTKRKRKFGRERDQRRQLMRSLMRAIILNEKIQTTEARAKSLRPHIEKMITKAKENSLHTRRLLLAKLNNDKPAVKKLLEILGPKYKERKGGYTRVTKVEARIGSGRTKAVIELI